MCGHVAMSCVLIFYPFDLFEVYYFILNFFVVFKGSEKACNY